MKGIKDNQLEIDVNDEVEIQVKWRGKSNHRNPSSILWPFFEELIAEASSTGRRIVMDLKEVSYINSSTITPLVQLLDEAKEKSVSITLLYSAEKAWQESSFSAMKFLECEEPLIRVEAQ